MQGERLAWTLPDLAASVPSAELSRARTREREAAAIGVGYGAEVWASPDGTTGREADHVSEV